MDSMTVEYSSDADRNPCDFEAILEKCGNYGSYQYRVLFLFGIINVLSSMHYFSQTIIAFTPEHWCYHDQLANVSIDVVREVYDQIEDPSCTRLESVLNGTLPIVANDERCDHWIYDKDHQFESITTELNWVCDKAHHLAVGQSFFYVGSVIGTISIGLIADKYGRLPAVLITTFCGGLGDFLTAFVPNMSYFIVTRFISGLSNDTFFMLMFILVFEYLKPQKRTFGLNITTSTFYCLTLMVMPWLAIFLGNWRIYILTTSIPVLLVMFYPLLMCESARWLLTKHRYTDAINCLKYVAKINRREVDERDFLQFINYYKEQSSQQKGYENDTFWEMFKQPRLRRFTVILLVKSIIITMAYDIASRNMEGLDISPMHLFSYSSLAYLPGGLTLIWFQNIIGRKGMACISLLMGGILTIITGFLIAFVDHSENIVLLSVMIGLGRYGAVVAYDAEAQYATEIIPTSVRGRAISNIHVIGYAVSFLNAYVIYLGRIFKPMPSIFIGVLMLLGAFLCLFLPETHNRKLPDNLKEGEEFGLHEKWYSFHFCDKIKQNRRSKEKFHKEIITNEQKS